MAIYTIRRGVDLDAPIVPEGLRGDLYATEDSAHKFIISATRGSEAVAFDGEVVATFIRADGGTVELDGSIEDGAVTVTLEASCYAVPGRFALTVYNAGTDDSKTAVYACVGTVINTTTDTIIDPGSVVPDVSSIVAEYETMQSLIVEARGVVSSSVRYDAAQTLTTAQKKQARDNIEAANEAEASYLEDVLITGKKIIDSASISAEGVIGYGSGRKLTCFPVQTGTEITVTGTCELYAFFAAEPEMGSVSYNASRTISTTINNRAVPAGCKWIAVRSLTADDLSITPNSKVDIIHSEDRIKWVNGRLSSSGSIVSSTYSIVTSNYNYVRNAGTLFIDMPTIGILGCAYYDANYQFISRADTENGMAAVAAGAVYARYTYQIDPTVDITPDEYGGQIHIYTDTGDVGNLLKTMLIEVPAWQAQTNYIVGDIVTVSGAYKVCKTAHTSGDQFVDTNWSNVTIWYAPDYMVGDCEIQYFAAEPNAGWSNGVIYYNTTLKRPFIVCGGTTKKYRIIPPIKNRVYRYNGMQLIYDEDKCEFEAVEPGKTFHVNEAPATLTAGYCISSTGAVTPAAAYSISTPIKLAPGDKIMYSSYVGATVCAIAETDAGATKYTPIIIGDTRSGAYEYAADHEMYIAFTMASGARYTGVVESTAAVGMTLNWEMPGFFTANGTITGPSSSVPGYAISTPVKLYAGDMVTFSCYAIANDPVMLEYQDRWNTYWANTLGNANTLIMPSATGYNTYTAYVRKTAHYVFSCNSTSTPAPVLTITRPISSDAMISAYETGNEWDYGQEKHNFVDKYDFVPDLTKKRTNAILAYSGDSKSNANYIVNAVAYPNGEIIAARAGGAVVKIALDGTETTLLTISNAQDWRGVFIDSNLNVYVSPHSGTFSPGVAATDRGLYRLPYGGSSFTKIISLCRSTTEIKVWATNTAYSVGDEVMRDNESDMYICSTAHTSGSTFDPTKWSAVPGWAANTQYTAGSLSKYNSRYFRCVADHTSGANFDTTKWNAATEYMANDDTIWTMCEDENGYLYAGVYSHSVRANPAVYRSVDGGSFWFYQHNFIMNGTLPESRYGNNAVRHVHCINFNEYDHCLYAAVGEVNTIVKSENHGTTWQDLKVACYYGQPTYVLGAPDGLVIGSDGHYSCGVSKLMTDGKTMKLCGRTAPGFIFNIRRSDITGWLYAWTRIDNIVAHDTQCPPPEAVDDEAVYNSWVANAPAATLRFWNPYHEWALKYYPEDARRPQNAVIMVSKDEGDTWEVINKVKVSQNYASICGYITVGYFREGECLAGLLKPIDDTESGKAFVQPVIISEGKKKHTANGYDLSGEIFIKTNTNNIVGY